MDDQQTNTTSGQDLADDVLPSVQQPAADAGQSNSAQSAQVISPDDGQATGGSQTIPDSRALVAVPEEAGDNDLIEKEWVLKAKQIVEQTAEDPYRQQEELSKMKADYMKKRYNKDLGVV